MKKRTLCFVVMFQLMLFLLKAQTVTPVLLSNQGGYSSLSGGSISWSIGEPVSETYTGSNNITTMGFHQPELTIQTLIQEQGEDLQVLIFPNPVSELLHVNLSGLEKGKYQIQLHDAAGKLILEREEEVSAQQNNFDIRMLNLSNGNYFLHVRSERFSKTVKITKVN